MLVALTFLRCNIAYLMLFFIFCFTFAISLFFTPYHVAGDQVHYNKLYDGVRGLNLIDGYYFYISNIDSKEFFHFLWIWVFTNVGFSKIFIMSLLNSWVACLMFSFFKRTGASLALVFIFVISNYYMYAMFFTLEKLKFSVLFLLLAAYCIKSPKKQVLFVIVSMLTHFQMIILFSMYWFSRQKIKFIFHSSWRKAFLLFVTLCGFFLFWHFLGDQILRKINYYYEFYSGNRLVGLLKLLVLFLITFVYSGYKKSVILFYIPFAFVVFFLGGDRLMMAAYFYCSYYLLKYNKGMNIMFCLFSFYMLFKTYSYLYMVYEYGG